MTWSSPGGGFAEWGRGGDFMYATFAKTDALDVWVWRAGRPVHYKEVPLPCCLAVSWVAGDRCLFNPVGDNQPEAVVMLAPTARECGRWELPQGWYAELTQPGNNGRCVAVRLVEDHSAPDYDWQVKRAKIGLLKPDSEAIAWVTLQGSKDHWISGSIESVVPSDDGRYIAVGGWDCGVAMIDVAAQTVLWSRKPPGETCVSYVGFSPDARVVYAGGTDGVVYAMDVSSGNVLGQWCATSSGRVEYGHRISCLAVSPDGQWVAAGTGPEGLVFVGSTATNKVVAILNHGRSTVLLVHFSPDSSALASFVPGTLKTWKTAKWPGAAPPPAPTTRPAGG